MMVLQDEIEILASTYEDTCCVYRPTMRKLPSLETVYTDKLDGDLIYQDMSCSLASSSGGKLSYKQPQYNAASDYLLFTRPDVDIQINDYLVIKQYGHQRVARAGLTDYYGSHNEVHVNADEQA